MRICKKILAIACMMTSMTNADFQMGYNESYGSFHRSDESNNSVRYPFRRYEFYLGSDDWADVGPFETTSLIVSFREFFYPETKSISHRSYGIGITGRQILAEAPLGYFYADVYGMIDFISIVPFAEFRSDIGYSLELGPFYAGAGVGVGLGRSILPDDLNVSYTTTQVYYKYHIGMRF